MDTIKGLLPYYGPLLSKVVTEDGPTRSIDRIMQIIEAHDAAEVGWLISVIDGWPKEEFKAFRADWRKRAQKYLDDEKLPEDEKQTLQKLIDACAGSTESCQPFSD
jgi:hypothetical protein